MRKQKLLIFTGILLLFSGGLVMAQSSDAHDVTMTISEIAVLNLSGGNITLTVTAPATGGETPASPTDNACYLQYTSTVGSGLTRNITAAWGGSDQAPAGCSLLVQASPSGTPGEGSTAGQVTVSGSATNVVTSVGSCATGIAGTDGSQLAYTLSVDTMSSLVAGESQTATVTYTLTDDS